LDSGSGKIDQEIVRVSHCGYMSLKNFYGLNIVLNGTEYERNSVFKGCLSVCDHDECNSAYSNIRKTTSLGYFKDLIFLFIVLHF